MARRRRTVRASIFLSVSLLIVCMLLAFSFVVYDYARSIARDRFVEALNALSGSIMTNVDSRVAEMDRLSLTMIYSQVFQGLFAGHLATPRQPVTPAQRIAKLENTEALIEICETILGPGRSAPQTNVYDFRGEMIGAGYYSQLIERDVTQEPWFRRVLAADGERILIPPHADPLLEETSIIVKGKRYISLLRTFQDSLLSTKGIIEVKQYCDSLFSEMDSLQGRSGTFYIFDETWNQLYPYDGTVSDPTPFRRIVERSKREPVVLGRLPGMQETDFFAVTTSQLTNWTLIMGEPAAGLNASLWQYTGRIVLLALLAITCSLAASYFIARRLTVPMKALHREIEELQFDNLDSIAPGFGKPTLGEVDELILAFRNMRLKLNESLNEAVSLRAHEKQAQLFALQAQLNPHFIYNMLQTLGIMAEDGATADMQGLILNLAHMLRYVSSTETNTATLGTEIEYAQSYLEGMRARFGASLNYSLEISEAAKGVAVPKLILQPFIENCFKYVTSVRPPWLIELRASRTNGRWSVEIQDNGPGFSNDALARLAARTAQPSIEGGIPELHISGMGMLNTYKRLVLTYGEDAVFEVSNRAEGGARIRIGGVGNDG